MLGKRVIAQVLGVAAGVVRVLAVRIDEDDPGSLVVDVRPRAQLAGRCPHCGLRCAQFDPGRVRRWRALDAGRVKVFIRCQVPRVSCPEHGVVVAGVPWARHAARHTFGFEQVAAWCAVEMSQTAATTLLRCSWRTIGVMVARVLADLEADSGSDGLDGLTRIGIDEISYRRGHRYLVVVVDHDSRRLVWARADKGKATVHAFFDDLGTERAQALTHITSDSAAWIADPVKQRAPRAVHCADPFHVVRWAGEALNLTRREVWNAVRPRRGRNRPAAGAAIPMRKVLWALRRDPTDWTVNQAAAMVWLQATHPHLHRAWQLKEALRAVFRLTGRDALIALDRWVGWARRCRLPEFVKVAAMITKHRASIDASLLTGMSNGLVESTNTKIRLITRRGYGFKNVQNMISLAKLALGHHKPQLPT